MTEKETAAQLDLAQLDKLEALARAATPGPWAYQEDSDVYTHIIRPVASPGLIIASATQTSKPEGEANGRWIAAANPATILALIAQARAAEKAEPISDERLSELFEEATTWAPADEDMPGIRLFATLIVREAAPQATASHGEQDERALFEAWFTAHFGDCARRDGGSYYSREIHNLWCAWRAARAALAHRTSSAPAEDMKLHASLHAVVLNAKAIIKRWESPLWRQEVGTNEFINQLRKAVEAADATVTDYGTPAATQQAAPEAPASAQPVAAAPAEILAAETTYQAEAAECLHMWLDDQGVPRNDAAADGHGFSLVGRVAYLVASEAVDAARFRWLNADHNDREARQKARELAERMGSSSYFAITRDIDAAMFAAPAAPVAQATTASASNIKTWRERLPKGAGLSYDYAHVCAMKAEIDELRAALAQQGASQGQAGADDAALLDWLNEQTVDIIYLDDFTKVDVRGNDVRAAIRAAIAATTAKESSAKAGAERGEA